MKSMICALVLIAAIAMPAAAYIHEPVVHSVKGYVASKTFPTHNGTIQFYIVYHEQYTSQISERTVHGGWHRHFYCDTAITNRHLTRTITVSRKGVQTVIDTKPLSEGDYRDSPETKCNDWNGVLEGRYNERETAFITDLANSSVEQGEVNAAVKAWLGKRRRP